MKTHKKHPRKNGTGVMISRLAKRPAARPTTEGGVVRGSEGLAVGDRVRVELVHTDVARGLIDFAAVVRSS